MSLYDSSAIKDVRYLTSQTPPNYVPQNYYLSTLQEKINADWPYRPNRKVVEFEQQMGSEEYTPIEVVVQEIRNDKGTAVSDDWYRLVFRDCQRQNRIGYRYRFDYDFDPAMPDNQKNIWIGFNQTALSPTSSQSVCRCNGTLGSIYVDESGRSHYHYEPVIQPNAVNSAGFDYSEFAIDQNGHFMVWAQYNKYTKQYYINQRFVVGTDQVYKVTNIVKYESRSTYNPEDVGLIRVYMAIDTIGDLDDMEKRIAYNGRVDEPEPTDALDNYALIISDPVSIPSVLPASGLTIQPHLMLGDKFVDDAVIHCDAELVGSSSSSAIFSNYCQLVTNADGSFTVTRKKISNTLSVKLTFSCSYNEHDFAVDVMLALRPF